MAKKTGLFDSLFKKIGLKVYDFNDIEECLRALQDKAPEFRIQALESLAQKEGLEDIAPLIKVMKEDQNFQVKEAAMNALGELRRPESVDPIMDMLSAPDQWLRVKAAMVLGQIGDLRALQAIKDAHQTVRGEYQATIERLISRMEIQQEAQREKESHRESSRETRTMKVPVREQPAGPSEVLGTVQKEKEEPRVETKRLHASELVDAANRAGRSFDDLFRFKQDPGQTRQEKQQRKIDEDKLEENLRFQLSRASSSAPDETMVRHYYRALKEGDGQAERALCDGLRESSETVRLQALQALMGLERKPYIVDEMLAALDTCSPKMCWRIIVALCGVEDQKIARKLLNFLDDPDEKIRKYANNYFLLYKGQEMVDVILRDFSQCEEPVKMTRAELVARMDSDEIKHVLFGLIQDPRQPERVIRSILDKLPPRQEDIVAYSLPILIRRKEESLIEAVPRFIKNINNLLLIEYLRQNLTSQSDLLRGRSALLLGHLMDSSSSAAIAKLLQDGSDYVRLKAAKSLLVLKVRDYQKQLYQIARKDSSLRNRLEVIQVIDSLYGDKAVELFLELLQEQSSETRCLLLDILSKRTWAEEEREKIISHVQFLFGDEDMRVLFYLILLLVKLNSRTFLVDRKKLLTVLWTVLKEGKNPSRIRKEALYALLYLSRDDAREILKDLLRNDGDDDVRTQAAFFLANFEGKDIEEALIQACRTQNQNLAKAAKESLRKLQLKS